MKLKRGKNLYVTVTTVAACSLFLMGFGLLYYAGLAAGSAARWWCIIVLLCCLFGAGGLTWLAWYWLNLSKGISSIVRRLREESLPHIKLGENAIVNQLSEAINCQFDINSKSIAVLEKQSEDLKIQLQLWQRQKKNTEAIKVKINSIWPTART